MRTSDLPPDQRAAAEALEYETERRRENNARALSVMAAVRVARIRNADEGQHRPGPGTEGPRRP